MDLAAEELFFNKNVKTAIQVDKLGSGDSCCHQRFRVYEYTPLQVKQAVVGYGRAEKARFEMVKYCLFKGI